MSQWSDYDLEAKITAILQDVRDYKEGYHLGRPFLTAYQITIAFAQRHPEDFANLGKPIGGAGTGQYDSLSKYIAGELSKRIKNGRIQHIEGAPLSNQHLRAILFSHGTEEIRSSLTETQYTLSMFRLRES